MKKDFTRDFRDIQYFIDHVDCIDARVDVIEKLGYKIGLDVVTKESIVGRITKGKKGEFRVQITPAKESFPLVKSAIVE